MDTSAAPLAYPIEEVPAVAGVSRTRIFQAIRKKELIARKAHCPPLASVCPIGAAMCRSTSPPMASTTPPGSAAMRMVLVASERAP
jgi:hypothetical protein